MSNLLTDEDRAKLAEIQTRETLRDALKLLEERLTARRAGLPRTGDE